MATDPVRFDDVRFGYWPKPAVPSPVVPKLPGPRGTPLPDPVRTVVVCSTTLYTGQADDAPLVERARAGADEVIAHRSGKALLNRCHSIRTAMPGPDDLPF